MAPLAALVRRAQAGDLQAFGDLIHATQSKVYALARSVLHDPALAEDAAQQAFLRAFRRLGELQERLDDVPEVPVLDEAESRWSDLQRHRLSAALLSLSSEDRQVCDRRWFRARPRAHRHAALRDRRRPQGGKRPAL
jgi:DNA-directed RNA polymerase specialized sigma24 family protein